MTGIKLPLARLERDEKIIEEILENYMISINESTDRENELLQKLRIMERTDKSNSPEFVKLLNELGFFYEDQCEYAHAEQIYRRSIKAMRFIKIENRNIQRLRIKTICNFGRVLCSQRKHVKSERVFFRALVIADQTFGPTHVEFARVLKYLGLLYEKMGNKYEAEPLYRRALLIIESRLASKPAAPAA